MPYGISCSNFRTDPNNYREYLNLMEPLALGEREKTWVRREMEKTVVPERKGAKVGDRVTKVRSKEAGNTAEVMWKGEKGKHK